MGGVRQREVPDADLHRVRDAGAADAQLRAVQSGGEVGCEGAERDPEDGGGVGGDAADAGREDDGVVGREEGVGVQAGAGAADGVRGGRHVGEGRPPHVQRAQALGAAAQAHPDPCQCRGAAGADGDLEGGVLAARRAKPQGGAAAGGRGGVVLEDLLPHVREPGGGGGSSVVVGGCHAQRASGGPRGLPRRGGGAA